MYKISLSICIYIAQPRGISLLPSPASTPALCLFGGLWPLREPTFE